MQSKKELDGIELKLVALLSMTLDHIGAVLIEPTWLGLSEIGQMVDICLRLAGRLAFPIYAFLLVEGFLHTRSWSKYMGRMALFAVISEIPFDMAAYGELTCVHQNVFFTLLIGLFVMRGMEKYSENKYAVVGIVSVGCCIAAVLHTDYSYMGILLIAVLYYLREEHFKRCVVSGVLFSYEITSVFAFMMIYRYTGKKGDIHLPKVVFYGFYPVHLLVLWGIRNALFC